MPCAKYMNKVDKALFDESKPQLQFARPYTIDVKPQALGRGFGWQGNNPWQVVNVKMHHESVSAQVMTSVNAQVGSCSLSKDEFLAKAEALPKRIVMDVVHQAGIRTFSTGSFGWHACARQIVSVGGVDLPVIINFQAVLQGTKPEGGHGEEVAASTEPTQSPAKRARHEKQLMSIAKERVKDGILDLDDCMVLWASAMDGNRVTPKERSTLIDIMEKFAVTEKGAMFLYSKLVNGDKKQVAPTSFGAISPNMYNLDGAFTPVFFNPGSDGCGALLEVLNQATKSLDIAVFYLTDDRLAHAIIRKHKDGVKVRVFADNDMGKKFSTCDLDELQRAGIEVRTDRTKVHMHHKFVVADRKIVVNGSLNWTTGSLRHNRENIVISRYPQLAAKFAQEFDRLWESFSPKGWGKYVAQDASWDSNIIALFFPDRADANFKILVDEVRTAKKTLDVAVFLITVRELVFALKDAHLRGVRVRVIMDDRQALHAHNGAHLKDLRAAGIDVRLDNSPNHMHHKFCVIDDSTLCNGSFNWTRQAEDANYENAVIFRKKFELARSFSQEFEKLWNEFGR